MAMRRGGTGARQGKTTHSPMPGVREKGPPPGPAQKAGPGVRCTAHRPVLPGTDTSGIGDRRREVEFADVFGHRTGHGSVSIGCREAVITNVARFRAPADHPCKRGDREPCMVKPRGETARVNAEVCVMRRCCMNPTRDMNLTNPNPLQPFSNSPSDSSLFPNHAFPYCAQTGNQLIPARPAFGGPFFTDAAVPRKGGAGNGETI